MKNYFDWLINRTDRAEESIIEFEDKSIDIFKVKHKENKECMCVCGGEPPDTQKLWNNIRCSKT